jgi:phosphosulfolactate phosphohydrolase-like enzyme
VYVCAFPNLSATGQRLQSESRPIHLVCAGTVGEVSLEDALLAGALVDNFLNDRVRPSLDNDAAQLAASAWNAAEAALVPADRLGQPRLPGQLGPWWTTTPPVSGLARWLTLGKGGRRVRELGLEPDIEAAARVDHCPLVAVLQRDPLRLVRG